MHTKSFRDSLPLISDSGMASRKQSRFPLIGFAAFVGVLLLLLLATDVVRQNSIRSTQISGIAPAESQQGPGEEDRKALENL